MNGTANCTNISHGGWWFTDCHTCNLNGLYGESNVSYIPWRILEGCEYNITRTEMKILPV
ncbi:Tenascin-N [Holothuria leucospilota]|uniref:Tenascin-N n=1 Tax=Holothuria leucospilota TaxID=206669 RepID=A0A9Q1BUF1_HOLLE|nr:Tenascin-N [Holothuria leucospilota]